MDEAHAGRVAVVGAAGYVGRLLVPALIAHRTDVLAVVRRPQALAGVPGIAVARADAASVRSLHRALEGCGIVFDLCGSPGTVADAALEVGVGHVVALRCLGEARRPSTPGVTTLYSGPIVGTGSGPFLVLRRLVERLPVVPAPRWSDVPAQPIAAGDVVRYLLAVADAPETAGRDFEIGGPDVLTAREMLARLSAALGRRTVLAPLPVEARGLSALLLRSMAGAEPPWARALVDHEGGGAVVTDSAIRQHVSFAPTPFRLALQAAIAGSGRRRPSP